MNDLPAFPQTATWQWLQVGVNVKTSEAYSQCFNKFVQTVTKLKVMQNKGRLNFDTGV